VPDRHLMYALAALLLAGHPGSPVKVGEP
jgi:hypothetical protein